LHPRRCGERTAAEKEPVSTIRSTTLSVPRRSVDFLEKRKGHSKKTGIISPRQETYVRYIARPRCAQAFIELRGAVATPPVGALALTSRNGEDK